MSGAGGGIGVGGSGGVGGGGGGGGGGSGGGGMGGSNQSNPSLGLDAASAAVVVQGRLRIASQLNRQCLLEGAFTTIL